MASGDRIIIPAMAAGFVSLFGRIEKGTGDTLILPSGMVNIGGNGKGYLLEASPGFNPELSKNSDGSYDGFTDFLTLGDDVYIYAVQSPTGIARWVSSKNSTVPTGYTASNSRKIGGFHVGKTRPASERFNAAYIAPTEIVWNSCWDLGHRPKCDPTGMVEVIPDSLWVDIYLASEGAGAWPDIVPVSQHSATPLTGTEGYSYSDFRRLALNAGKRLPDYNEFMQYAYGVPQGATGSTGRISTGQHSNYGFGAISCLNVDQPSGNVHQAGSEVYDRVSGTEWKNDLNTGKDGANNHGQWYGGEMRQTLFGGHWANAAGAGSRCVFLVSNPWGVISSVGFRAVCDSL